MDLRSIFWTRLRSHACIRNLTCIHDHVVYFVSFQCVVAAELLDLVEVIFEESKKNQIRIKRVHVCVCVCECRHWNKSNSKIEDNMNTCWIFQSNNLSLDLKVTRDQIWEVVCGKLRSQSELLSLLLVSQDNTVAAATAAALWTHLFCNITGRFLRVDDRLFVRSFRSYGFEEYRNV